ncbi:MAG: peptidoglycan DD-metalloendopeptidase family protein [Lactobacillus sp.]|jgi:murein DD-endopeptidase MepM/ murein hydrolase activator NlpD|nr:peptidoglycan DD-metalloendopeptidase family protein [Lactobacillus sp.]
MRKVVLILMFLVLTGCQRDGLRLFNMDGLWGSSRPNQITVVKGDTLYSLSKQYNVPLRDLIERNSLRPPYTLSIGQTIYLPASRFHTVAKGDTLYNISKRYNVDITSLSRHNNLAPPYTLSIGQKLALPGSVGGSSAVVAASASASATASASVSASKTASSVKKPATKAATKPAATKTTKTVAKKTTAKKATTKTAYVAPSKTRKSKFSWPLRGQILSPYGTIAKGRNNDGINIKASLGAAIKAADSGTVAYAGNELKGFGNLILIKHADGWITAYAHNDKLLVKKGQKVARGEKIATAGSTGGVNTPQLHFEVRQGKKPVNPISYLEK